MGRAVIAKIYKERAATAECVNALARMRGLVRFAVRGLERVKAASLWYALAHDVKRAISMKVFEKMTLQMQRAAA